ncbi:zinc ribbon domain-containing protein, partial [Candidatus Bathyarchaeota archaeon]|nr:zinc ribbon domain-containing protein [Candidatus Bathyarchaeota archaeon]
MPYCWKCGAELDEEAKFCPTCGTPVAPPVTELERRRIKREKRRPISTSAVVLIVLVVIATVSIVLAFLPVRLVDEEEGRSVAYQAGVDVVNLDFITDVGHVNIVFQDLTEKLVTLNVSATGRTGVLVSPNNLFDLTFDYTIADNVLTVISEVDTVGGVWPWYSGLRVTCDLRIDPSLNASLDVNTSVGRIVMDTQAGVVLNSLGLEATTGGVEVDLVEDVVVTGDVSVKTT